MAGQPIPTSGARALADRLAALESQVNALRAGATSGFTSAVTSLVSVDSPLDALTEAMIAPTGDTVSVSNPGLTSNAWATLATVTMTGPEWASRAVVTAIGSVYLVASAEYAVPTMRVQIGGVTSSEVELPPGTGASGVPFFGTLPLVSVASGSSVTCSVQVSVLDAGQWMKGAINRSASISATAMWLR